MLEKYLSNFLTAKFSHLVEDFDKEAINISAWKGAISMKDLVLKQTALETLDNEIPLEIAYGKIGSLDLQIPWSSLMSKSSSIVLTDVSLLIAPRKVGEKHAQDDEMHHSSKEEKVQVFLNPKLLQSSIAQTHKSNRLARFLSWVSSSVFRDLSVTIKNIHIRYEDPGSSLGFVWNNEALSSSSTSFAVGMTLRQFSVQTTNIADGDSDVKVGGATVQRKLAAIYQLAIYWDHDCPLIAVRASQIEDGVAARQHSAAAFSAMEGGTLNPGLQHYSYEHSYVVEPISPSLQFSLVSGGESPPPSTITMSLPPCHIQLSRNVLESVAYLRKSYSMWNQSKLAAELNETLNHLNRIRPTSSVASDPQAWWRYSIEATVILGKPSGHRRRRHGWSAVAFAIAQRIEYVELYRRLLSDSDPQEAHQELTRMEEKLEVEEIVAFRLKAYQHMLSVQLPDQKQDQASKVPDSDQIMSGVLSMEARRAIAYDAIRLLKQASPEKESDPSGSKSMGSARESPLQWKTSLFCPELSLQVNGRNLQDSVKPIARLTFACVQRQFLRLDGSWDLDATVASFSLIDMSVKGSICPTLVGSKISDGDEKESKDDCIFVSGKQFCKCMQLEIRRKFTESHEGRFSTTHSIVRLQPLVVTYSSNPIARLTHVFSSIQTPELASDYERMASVVSRWQETQRQRLLQALAHKRKKITVDVDISAPVVLIPEDLTQSSGPMLVVDLGRVQFRNARSHEETHDDVWTLELSEMQMQSSQFISNKDPQIRVENHSIVEPFSLEFKIATTFAARKSKSNSKNATNVLVDASLPRLVFNLRSSSLRLTSRLMNQWKKIRQVAPHHSFRRLHHERRRSSQAGKIALLGASTTKGRQPSSRHQAESSVMFLFSAPIIAFKLENDVDGRDHEQGLSTPIVNLALRGFGGKYQQRVSDGWCSSQFESRMRSLEAVDRYQQAGPDFSLLLSSVSPTLLPKIALHTLVEQTELPNQPTIETDLVSIMVQTNTYVAGGELPHPSRRKSRSVSAEFHELFIEWNPETIAAIHKAIKMPIADESCILETSLSSLRSSGHAEGTKVDSDEEFYDAFEDEQALSLAQENVDDNSTYLVSEISSSSSSAPSERQGVVSSPLQNQMISSPMFSPSPTLTWRTPLQPLLNHRQLSPIRNPQLSPIRHPSLEFIGDEAEDEWSKQPSEFEPFELTFGLSTLRVAFNKETRHRRLIVAEMDNTTVTFMKREEGGSRTVAKMGNLELTDPSAEDSSTLYKQILGLKADPTGAGQVSSLLEMEFFVNSRERNFEAFDFAPPIDLARDLEHLQSGVTINTALGEVRGCNYFVDLRFSPMRFVYLQQLWFEIMDYFFEGVTGYEVMGNKRPFPVNLDDLGVFIESGLDSNVSEGSRRRSALLGADADGIGFTRFRVSLSTPDVLIPVEYRSPHFVRVNCQSLEVSNLYSSRVHKISRNDADADNRVQWYNTCTLRFNALRLHSWCGSDLTPDPGSNLKSKPGARIQMSWPVGPTARLVLPKWKVKCNLGEISFVLRSQDYALFQHVIMYNIGEPSRHLDEWIRFQNMAQTELEDYKKKIMVHYGYDRKDTAPTTYDLEFEAPLIDFHLSSHVDNKTIALAQCVTLVWTMKKLPDCIVRQKLEANFKLSVPPRDHSKHPTPLLLPTKRGTALDGRPDIIYRSSSAPSGDNVKSLEIIGSGINLLYPAWMDALGFFSSIEPPPRMSPEEIKNSLQIGDRWYSLGMRKTSEKQNDLTSVDYEFRPLIRSDTARLPKFQFRLHLDSPRIVLDSENGDDSVILHMDHVDYLHINDRTTQSTTRTFFVHCLELYTVSTRTTHRDEYSLDNSLISPWSFTGQFQKSMEHVHSKCEKDTLKISAEIVKARAAFSDMIIALDVSLRLLRDVRGGRKGAREYPRASEALLPKNQQGVRKLVSEDDVDHTEEQASLLSVNIDGFHLVVVDDSMRHFASAQELISFSLGRLVLSRNKVSSLALLDDERKTSLSDKHCPASSFVARIERLDLMDHLQKQESPFRKAASCLPPTKQCPSGVGTERVPTLVLDWNTYRNLEDPKWGYVSSSALCDLMKIQHAKSEILRSFPAVLEYHGFLVDGVKREHALDINSFSMQWNPSTVIALQRFLGRLMKEVRKRSKDLESRDASPLQNSAGDSTSQLSHVSTPLEAVFSIGMLSICLNKEHQNRRLLRVALAGTKISMTVDRNKNFTYVGRVEDVEAWDEDNYKRRAILEEHRAHLKVLGKSVSPQQAAPAFFQVRYSKFSFGSTTEPPSWVMEKLNQENIDDYLNISVGAVQVTYLRERTEELIDYLSNGLPGKGMGATSKAAKVFINRRMQTRSFLDLTVAAPQLRIPQSADAENGLLLRLGDFQLRTWFELDVEEWCRALSISVMGLGWNTYFRGDLRSNEELPVDLHFDLRKFVKSKSLSLRGRLTSVTLLLKYSDYALLRAVLNNNVGRKPDISKWDNIEKAFWSEAADEGEPQSLKRDTNVSSKIIEEVAYSSSARFIRYGTRGRLKSVGDEAQDDSTDPARRKDTSEKLIDFGFKMDGVNLTLHRDDDIDGDATSEIIDQFHYDVVHFRLEAIDVSFSQSIEGDTSFQISLSRIGLYDKGDLGRLAREQYYINLAEIGREREGFVRPVRQPGTLRNPSAFQVIAEGCTSNETDSAGFINKGEPEPQVVLTVDTCPSTAAGAIGSGLSSEFDVDRVTVARMVVNHLSVNAMIRPLREVSSFLSCSWSTPRCLKLSTAEEGVLDDGGKQTIQHSAKKDPKKSSGFQFKLVAHYPRVFVVADESDVHSRALVLRGLAVINASLFKQSITIKGFEEEERFLALNASLHQMESFINPDVSLALGESLDENKSSTSNKSNTLGVALIQPVTAGIEFQQISKELFPTIRSVHLNIEPVSTMLSFEDLRLLNQVLQRWTVEGRSSNRTFKTCDENLNTDIYQVVIHGARLGLGLKNTAFGIVVDSVERSGENSRVQEGDKILEIDGQEVTGMLLKNFVNLVEKRARPMTLTFCRRTNPAHSEIPATRLDDAQGSNKILETVVSEDEKQKWYKLSFRMGVPCGMIVQRSQLGDMPIVTDVDVNGLTQALVGVDDAIRRGERDAQLMFSDILKLPRPGAVIVAVSGLRVVDLGFDETARVLEEFTRPSFADEAEELRDAAMYSISFIELPSKIWGSIDSLDARVAGIALTFIDDFQGRDMPLVRGKISSIETHVERGIGLLTDVIDTATASAFGTVAIAVDNPESLGLTTEGRYAVRELSRERVTKLAVSCEADVDYYHSQIAVWEPFIEPSRVSVSLVWKPGVCTGDQKRPGQLSVEISDKVNAVLEGAQQFGNLVSNGFAVNITDAVAEVTARALRQFKKWKDNLKEPFSIEEPSSFAGIEGAHCYPKDSEGYDDDFFGAPVAEGEVRSRKSRNAKRAAAREAAQAALLFAQKRGADIQKKGESAKPFVLRNRTGMSLRFCQQPRAFADTKTDAPAEKMIIVDAGAEARFQMEIISMRMRTSQDNYSVSVKKVRSYEGRFPHILVMVTSPGETCMLEPLYGLQVSKVGTFLREITVIKKGTTEEGTPAQLVIPLLWTVELEDNRRILTLRSAVQISSIALGLSLDVGFARRKKETNKLGEIESIGSVAPGNPYYIPLWISLLFQEVEIFIRASAVDDGPSFGWGNLSILKFEPQNSEVDMVWQETFDEACSIICSRPGEGPDSLRWLSCIIAERSVEGTKAGGRSDKTSSTAGFSKGGTIHLTIDSSISIRNMLPVPLDWQLSDPAFNIIDGSAFQKQSQLASGASLETFACDLTVSDAHLRLRCLKEFEWTDWAQISIPNLLEGQKRKGTEGFEKDKMTLPVQQITVHTVDDLGCPLHFGMRMTPKLTSLARGDLSYYGLEVVVFAELWFRNFTDLPICFGCPWSQIRPLDVFESEVTDELSILESASKAAAESTLQEIASIFEFGEKGKELKGEDRGLVDRWNIYNVPLQSCELVCHEVFEYIEVDASTVKRRWWASEQYDSLRKPTTQYKDRGSYWEWIDDSWSLDSSGGVRLSEGAWESCRSLNGSEYYFSGSRIVDAGHIFRRRRWFRRARCNSAALGLDKSINCFHQPARDSFSSVQKDGKRKENPEDSGKSAKGKSHRFSLRCRDGEWSSMAHIPLTGPAEGVIRVFSSRWPTVTKRMEGTPKKPTKKEETTLTPQLYEVCYSIVDLPGDWGEFSRLVSVSPRFLIKNISSAVIFEVKQTGVPDTEVLEIRPGEVVPFYWADFRLPELVSVRPLCSEGKTYRWSGGFDICTLGTIPLRIRTILSVHDNEVFSVEALVEIRPGSSGINVSLKEEDSQGIGALYRVENRSPFPIWITQDGVLANPLTSSGASSLEESQARRHFDQVHNLSDKPPMIDGDIVLPNHQKAFGLDVPFRQGKYATRKAASLEELLRVRVGLAPLSTRDGIETTKVLFFTTVGASIRLNISKLRPLSSLSSRLANIRVLGVVTTDGPTRVLRFVLVQKDESVSDSIGNSITQQTGYRPNSGSSTGSFHAMSRGEELYCQVITKAAMETIDQKQARKIPTENDAKREAFFSKGEIELDPANLENDIVFSFRAYIGSVVFSLIDSAPSEIALVAVKGLEAAAKWNMNRTGDANAFISVSWLQVDNHVPNAQYPVAVCPDLRESIEDTNAKIQTPLLMTSLKFAPKHQSGILCLRSVTIAPSNLAIAIDLAFVVRLQGMVAGIYDHFARDEEANALDLVGIDMISLPNLEENIYSFSESESLRLYFEGLTILPSNVKLSVAPARALTPAQALVEGSQAAAIHYAVRKGDVRFAGGGGLGVTVGRRNRTAMAVVRGVFKSIIVDALLRLDGASMNLEGISLRNYVSSGRQLKAYLVAHYLATLRNNVPALLGSLAAFGNPLGLLRGIGDGVSDFVNEPVKGLKRSLEELDAFYVVDGVARGTESLARHTVGGIADSASMLTETFSKNMAVLTLDRRYAQRRDIVRSQQNSDLNFLEGVESGVAQLVRGVIEGVTGVVSAPLRGAEKSGLEGFAKGIGKGLLGLLVKPVIGLSDAATDVMIGVKSSIEGGKSAGRGVSRTLQLRPRRTMYGKDRTLKVYSLADAAASTLMLRTKLAGEAYLSHLDMGDRVLLVSDKKFLLLSSEGRELLLAKFKHVRSIDVTAIDESGGEKVWSVAVTMYVPRKDQTIREVLSCGSNYSMANELAEQLQRGLSMFAEG